MSKRINNIEQEHKAMVFVVVCANNKKLLDKIISAGMTNPNHQVVEIMFEVEKLLVEAMNLVEKK